MLPVAVHILILPVAAAVTFHALIITIVVAIVVAATVTSHTLILDVVVAVLSFFLSLMLFPL